MVSGRIDVECPWAGDERGENSPKSGIVTYPLKLPGPERK